MLKKKKSQRKPSIEPLPTMAWFKGRFDKLEQQHAIIVKNQEGGNVSQELSDQIRLACGQGRAIDQKVPDQNVPYRKIIRGNQKE